ncbi:MAG: O-antigen polysaccharide polymerase Wzy [Pirellulales bacterium]
MSATTTSRSTLIPPALPLVVQVSACAASVVLWAFSPDSPAAVESWIYGLCVFFTALYAWSAYSWYVTTGKLFDFYQLFLLAVALFHGGQAFLEVFGLNHDGFLESKFSDNVALQTMLVTTMCFTALHLGALLAVKTHGAPCSLPNIDIREQREADLRLVGWGMLAVAIPFTLLGFRSLVGVVLSGGYMALYQQDVSAGFGAIPKVLATFFMPGAMFLLAGSRLSRNSALFVAAIVCVFAMMQFFIGERHNGALALVSLAWLWHRTIKPLNPTVLLGGALVMGMIVFPLVRATRETSGSERTSTEQMIERYVSIENPAVSAVHEMGGSVYTLAYTMTLVPSEREYDLGESYFFAILTLFPNLIWEVHPSIAKGIPGDWLSWIVDPYSAARGAGFGYSLFGEAYLNFGSLGGAAFMLFFGWAYAAFTLWADRPGHPARWAFAASMAFFFLFIARSEFAIVVRGIAWYSFIPFWIAVTLLPAWRTWTARHETRRRVVA